MRRPIYIALAIAVAAFIAYFGPTAIKELRVRSSRQPVIVSPPAALSSQLLERSKADGETD